MDDDLEAPAASDEPAKALPMRRIAGLWAWLPAFRAVAETENLRRAATFLALSPPALSRTLKLLEDAVGHALFVREGRSLKLTERGRILLTAVRSAMRSIDEVLDATPEVVRVQVPPVLATLVARALARLGEPVAVTSRRTALATTTHDLLRGALDLAFVTESALGSEPLPDALVRLPVDDIPFVIAHDAVDDGPLRTVSLGGEDGWPRDRPRGVVLSCDDLATALEWRRAGLALALPLALVAAGEAHEPVGPMRLVALRRAPLSVGTDRIGEVLERVKASLAVP